MYSGYVTSFFLRYLRFCARLNLITRYMKAGLRGEMLDNEIVSNDIIIVSIFSDIATRKTSNNDTFLAA